MERHIFYVDKQQWTDNHYGLKIEKKHLCAHTHSHTPHTHTHTLLTHTVILNTALNLNINSIQYDAMHHTQGVFNNFNFNYVPNLLFT